ncbi:MAG TPA: hypothetical protein VGV92_01750 [Gammaproteobacteria bacterium]|nr:hypothetical protein [Gammaproteobacteria bacterium]
MLVHLSNSFPSLWLMITALSWVIGIVLVLRGVAYLKIYGELRTMTATQSSLKIPIVFIGVGCVFLFIPTAFQTMAMTAFGTSSPLGWQSMNTSINPIVLRAIGGFVQLLGLVSFIRGWMMLVANAQSPGGGHASFGKAATHIVGGFFLLNVYAFGTVLWNSFGLS